MRHNCSSLVLSELTAITERSILTQISETYGAKVEASSRDQVIRVTSDHDTCLDILKLIIHTLGNIESSTISLPAGFKGVPQSQGPIPDKDTHEAIIGQVMQLTNTIIREIAVPAPKREVSIELIVCLLAADFEEAEHILPWT